MIRILVSAYSCEPGKGSEPGAGYALARAAAEIGPCVVLTRENNLASLQAAFESRPTTHPVRLVGLDGPGWSLALKRRFGLVRSYYSLWQYLAGRRAAALDREVGGFDVVHHATMSAFWMPIGVGGLGRPLVVGPVSGGTFTPRSLVRYLGWKGGVKDAVRLVAAHLSAFRTRRWWRTADVVIAQNREMYRFAEKRLIDENTELLQHSHAAHPPVEIPQGTGGRTREVLFVGRVVAWKGVLLAVDAFARAGLTDARLVIIGEGPDVDAVRDRAAARGIADAVELTGGVPRDDVLARMRTASCLLFPSFHDSAGFVVSEALSLGLPVVCLDHGGPGELVRIWTGTDSTAVPPGSRRRTVEALAEALRDYVDDPRPVPETLVHSVSSLTDVVGEAYGKALGGRQL